MNLIIVRNKSNRLCSKPLRIEIMPRFHVEIAFSAGGIFRKKCSRRLAAAGNPFEKRAYDLETPRTVSPFPPTIWKSPSSVSLQGTSQRKLSPTTLKLSTSISPQGTCQRILPPTVLKLSSEVSLHRPSRVCSGKYVKDTIAEHMLDRSTESEQP